MMMWRSLDVNSLIRLLRSLAGRIPSPPTPPAKGDQ